MIIYAFETERKLAEKLGSKIGPKQGCRRPQKSSRRPCLETCKAYTKQEFESLLKYLKIETDPLISSFFLNIDGNNANFNTLLAELERMNYAFPIIGLTETNIDEPLKDLYLMNNYTSYYQDTLKGKFKGSGVAIYVNNDLNASAVENLSYSSPDIESLFVEISNVTAPVIYGVIY